MTGCYWSHSGMISWRSKTVVVRDSDKEDRCLKLQRYGSCEHLAWKQRISRGYCMLTMPMDTVMVSCVCIQVPTQVTQLPWAWKLQSGLSPILNSDFARMLPATCAWMRTSKLHNLICKIPKSLKQIKFKKIIGTYRREEAMNTEYTEHGSIRNKLGYVRTLFVFLLVQLVCDKLDNDV